MSGGAAAPHETVNRSNSACAAPARPVMTAQRRGPSIPASATSSGDPSAATAIAMAHGSLMCSPTATVGARDTVVWGTTEDDTVVWGTTDDDTVVWGTTDDDTVVWGTSDGDTVVWGTLGRRHRRVGHELHRRELRANHLEPVGDICTAGFLRDRSHTRARSRSPDQRRVSHRHGGSPGVGGAVVAGTMLCRDRDGGWRVNVRRVFPQHLSAACVVRRVDRSSRVSPRSGR